MGYVYGPTCGLHVEHRRSQARLLGVEYTLPGEPARFRNPFCSPELQGLSLSLQDRHRSPWQLSPLTFSHSKAHSCEALSLNKAHSRGRLPAALFNKLAVLALFYRRGSSYRILAWGKAENQSVALA